MVVGVKKTIQQVPSRGRISLMRLQHLTLQKKQSVSRVIYGALMITLSMVSIIVSPIELVTNYILDVREGSFIYKMYENLPYELYCEVWLFNYTNVPQYLSGANKTLKVKDIGPFMFQEIRSNENITVDREKGVMSFVPKTQLVFREELSVAHYRDVPMQIPNIALVAMSTLFADRLGYVVNRAAYYSMKTIGSKLFLNMTAEKLMWGYRDPVVTVANTFLPGWIDFDKIGIMDRFYSNKVDQVEVEIKNATTKFSINSWNNYTRIKEQTIYGTNDSIPCNTIKGSYEGLMVSPKMPKDKIIPIYRKQACRIMPLEYSEEMSEKFGFTLSRYVLQQSAFNLSSKYACPCKQNCLPDGFIDVSNCYYGFPIALSKPHFLDADPEQLKHYDGLNPDPAKFGSHVDIEPTLGVPIAIGINMQVNLAVRTSPANPITHPLDKKILPIAWISLFCREPPGFIINLLHLRFVVAPPLLITVEVLLFIVGLILGVQGFHRIWKPKYKLIEPEEEVIKPARKRSMERRLSTVILNMTDNIGFKREEDDELAKQAVSLLAITEEDNDMPDLLMRDS